MEYWSGGYVQDLLIIICLIAAAAGIRRQIGPLHRLGMPDALLAGALGLLLGPTVLGLLQFSAERLEFLIYHALALVFISVSLQSPPHGKPTGDARSIAFAIPVVAAVQGIIGLLFVLGWNMVAGAPDLHTGFAMMLTLGFNQGPSQAMALGSAWEANAGMRNGAQLGLIVAAVGLAWCCIIGVALVAWARWRGWDVARGRAEAAAHETDQEHPPPAPERHGWLEPLTAQLVAIAITYMLTWEFLEFISPYVPEKFRATLWGFHFLIATGFAMLVRPVAARLPGGNPLNDDLLVRVGNTVVDIATCAAIAAVSVTVLAEYFVPVLLLTTIGGVVTLIACVWMARRAFPTAPFQHAIITYGSLTGTTTTGMAVLRMLDPQLNGPAARNYVLAVAPSALLGLPLFVVMPMPVLAFQDAYPEKAWLVLGILCVYTVVLIVLWRFMAPLRFGKRWWRLWPSLDDK
jgi:ESS family glutamate:Na+ symporter